MKMRKIFWLSVVLFVSVLSSRLIADDFTISGTVSDESGKPVAGAQVYLQKDVLNQDKISITDDNGKFTLSLPEKFVDSWQGMFAVSADKKQLGSTRVDFEEGNLKPPVFSITLKPARIITGNVTDADGKPIEGVLVAGVDQIVYPNFTKTDKNGDFSFAYPNAYSTGTSMLLQKVVAFLDNVGMDYVCTEELGQYRGKVPPEKIKNDKFQLKLTNFQPHKLRVTDEKGTPLAGVEVWPWLINKENEQSSYNSVGFPPPYLQSFTDTDGTVVVKSIGKTTNFQANGTDEGTIMPDGSRCFFSYADERWDKFDPSESIPTLVLKRRGNVKGSVRLADGTPVAWSRITIKRHDDCGHALNRTDQNGEFTLGWYEANKLFDIGVESKLGAAAGAFGFDVGNGIEEKRLDFVLQKGIRLHGTIYKPDKTPAENYHISIHEKCPEDLLATIQILDLDKDKATCPPGGCPTGIVVRQQSDSSTPNSQGKYEYLLPSVPRKYDINISLRNDPDLILNLTDYEVKGDENEILLDFHLKPKEKK